MGIFDPPQSLLSDILAMFGAEQQQQQQQQQQTPLSYESMLRHIQNDPRLGQMFTPMANVREGYNSGFGDHNAIGRDAINSLGWFGLAPTARTVQQWNGEEASPNLRVSRGWGDLQPILGWEARQRKK